MKRPHRWAFLAAQCMILAGTVQGADLPSPRTFDFPLAMASGKFEESGGITPDYLVDQGKASFWRLTARADKNGGEIIAEAQQNKGYALAPGGISFNQERSSVKSVDYVEFGAAEFYKKFPPQDYSYASQLPGRERNNEKVFDSVYKDPQFLFYTGDRAPYKIEKDGTLFMKLYQGYLAEHYDKNATKMESYFMVRNVFHCRTADRDHLICRIEFKKEMAPFIREPLLRKANKLMGQWTILNDDVVYEVFHRF